MRPPVDRHFPIEKINNDQDHEIEDTAAEHVAYGYVGHLRRSDRTDAGGKLRQRSNGPQEYETDPVAGQAGLVRDDVAAARQLRPGHADQEGAGSKFEPNLCPP